MGTHFLPSFWDICTESKKISLSQASLLSSPIEYLKGVGPLRADMLKKELEIYTFGDLLQHFPYRHIDKTQLNTIASIQPDQEFIQVKRLIPMECKFEKFDGESNILR